MDFCRPVVARPSMERQGTPTRYGVWSLVIGAFRSVAVIRPAYFLKYFRTYGGNLSRRVVIQRGGKKWNLR